LLSSIAVHNQMADDEVDRLCFGAQSLSHHLPYRLLWMEDHQAYSMDSIERGSSEHPTGFHRVVI
jgi:hypothetical protein